MQTKIIGYHAAPYIQTEDQFVDKPLIGWWIKQGTQSQERKNHPIAQKVGAERVELPTSRSQPELMPNDQDRYADKKHGPFRASCCSTSANGCTSVSCS